MEPGLLKQRIVGGLVLVAIAVIVIPFVLDFGHEREWWGHTSRIPEPPEQGFVTRVLPLDDWARQAESELSAGMAAMDEPLKPPVSADSPPPSTPVAPAPPPVVPPSQPAAAPAAPAAAGEKQAWVVQLGSFSSKKNADDLSGFLIKRGFRAFVERNMQGGDAVYRVRIGPETERGRADALRERVEHETQLRAIVLAYP